jgi:Protein of unknown function (DUF3800)
LSREYVIYTDESTKDGKYFGNFYGGALIRSGDIEDVRNELSAAAIESGLTAEIKWQKVSAAYLDRYKRMMDTFFRLIGEDAIKVRIMFTQRIMVPRNLTPYHREHTYQLLYYQFLKHAFGLRYSNQSRKPIRLRIYLDSLPDTREKNAIFKGYLAGLEHSKEFRAARIRVPKDQIAEVRSHDHLVLQCLDVVLGAMQFRLNDMHREKPAGQQERGSRTIAKEKLYRHINAQIREIHPNFNVGSTTGTSGQNSNRWRHSYRHWLFVPANAELDLSKGKHKKKDPDLAMP